MKYSLRSLMIVVLVLPPVLAWTAPSLCRCIGKPKFTKSAAEHGIVTVVSQKKEFPFTLNVGPTKYKLADDGVTLIVDLDAEFHQKPAPWLKPQSGMPNSQAPSPNPPKEQACWQR